MKDTELKEKIRRAFGSAVPSAPDRLLSDCKEQRKGLILPMNTTNTTKHTNKALRRIAGVAAALLIAVGGFLGYRSYSVNYAVASTVSLDVNPGIQITVNRKERVLKVTPLNEDGKKVIGEMDFSGNSIDVTVNALIGSMLRYGYISELANSILISVDNSSGDNTLQQRLSEEVSALLQTGSFNGAILSQTVTSDDSVKKMAEQYGITVGKAQLINRILSLDGMKTFEELAPLSINELNLIVNTYTGTDGLGSLSSVGQASEKAYIGEAKAREAVLRHAGLTEDQVARYHYEMDMENGVLVYEIELTAGDYEYEYDVNARTGEIVKHKKELLDDRSPSHRPDTTLIPVEEAKSAALKAAGLNAADVTFIKVDLDEDDGVRHYDIEFVSGKVEYDCEVNAVTGAVIKLEKEPMPSLPSQEQKPGTTLLSENDALKLVYAHAGVVASQATHVKVKLDYDDGRKLYEIEFHAGGYEYDYEVNAVTGDIVKSEKERDENAGGQQSGGNTLISAAEAQNAALKHAGLSASEVVFEKAQLEYDDGMRYYEIEFYAGGYEYDYEIDAVSGKVLSAEKDRDD